MAHKQGYVAGNAVFHSDRGSQCTSTDFAHYAQCGDIRFSHGATGVCWDNAVAESFFCTLELHALFDRRQFDMRAHARVIVAEWIERFYNRQRIHSTTKVISAVAMNTFLNKSQPALKAA